MSDRNPRHPVLVASNRGPVSFAFADDGSLTRRRGGGGMVSGLSSALAASDAADAGSRVLIQDYPLALAPRLLRDRRHEARIGHFSHTPWAPPAYFRMLPDDVAAAILDGMLGADHLGFLADRWADAFLDCCESVLGAPPSPARSDDTS